MPAHRASARGGARSGAGRPDEAAAPRFVRQAARRAATDAGFDGDEAAAAAAAQRPSTRSNASGFAEPASSGGGTSS
eukprot:6174622-Pleurochrysis_carterae.AAC.1